MAAGLPVAGRLAARWRPGPAIVKTQSPEAIRSTSILRSSRAFVILAIMAMSTVNFAGPDLWRYLLGGRIFLTTGHLPLRDTFSYTAYGLPWLQHEWLAQTIMTLFYTAMGGFGLKLLKLGCDAAMICLLAAAMDETGAPARVQRPVLILVALALAPQMQFRPQLFTDLLLCVLVALMAEETYRGSSKLWLAVPLFCLWVNLHGGFVVGLAALALYACVVTVCDLITRGGLQRGARLAAITAGSAAATLINPFGINAWLIVTNTVKDPFVNQYIGEWMSLPKILAGSLGSFAAVIYIIPIALVVVLAVCFVMTPTLDDVPMLAVAAMLAMCAVDAVRNMPLAVISAAIPLARHAGLVALQRERARSTGSPTQADRGFNPILAGALAVVLAWTGGIFSPRFRLGLDYPSGAVVFMKEHRVHGNILSSFRWGGYLMSHMGPESRVFMDERWNLLYPHRVMVEFIRFDQAQPGAAAVLDESRNDFVLVAPDSRSFGVAAGDNHWKILFADPVSVLFARQSFQLTPAAGTDRQSAPADFFP